MAVAASRPAAGGTNEWTDSNAAALYEQRFYSVRVNHAGQTLTNDQVWAMYTRPRVDSARYLSSVPVDYGTNNTLASLLGAHLARGLHAGISNATADELEFRGTNGNYQVYYLREKDGAAKKGQGVELGESVEQVGFLMRAGELEERRIPGFRRRRWRNS